MVQVLLSLQELLHFQPPIRGLIKYLRVIIVVIITLIIIVLYLNQSLFIIRFLGSQMINHYEHPTLLPYLNFPEWQRLNKSRLL